MRVDDHEGGVSGGFTAAGACLAPLSRAFAGNGTFPERHGLSTNLYYDRATRAEVFMEQVSFVREPLLFERFKAAGWSTALVTAKEKLTKLLRRGIDVCVDMKTHPEPHRSCVPRGVTV